MKGYSILLLASTLACGCVDAFGPAGRNQGQTPPKNSNKATNMRLQYLGAPPIEDYPPDQYYFEAEEAQFHPHSFHQRAPPPPPPPRQAFETRSLFPQPQRPRSPPRPREPYPAATHPHSRQQQQPHQKQQRKKPTRPLDILDHNISEQSIRQHYQEWCAKFRKQPDNFRFMVFQRNYLSQFKWNLAAGKPCFTLNEYADCTEEEYNTLMKEAAKNVVTGPLAKVEAQEPHLEVTLIVDEDGEHKLDTNALKDAADDQDDYYYDDDDIMDGEYGVMDAEVVEAHPYLAQYS